jgi:hypothetical protein
MSDNGWERLARDTAECLKQAIADNEDSKAELSRLSEAWKIAEPHLPQDVYRRALAALAQ